MKAVNDLDFLSLFWAEAKAIGQRVINDLPKGSIHYSDTLVKVNPQSTIKMFLVPYSQLGNSWSVETILNRLGGDSETLKVLADKINYMILEGRANDVKPMLEKICSGRIKSQTHKVKKVYEKSKHLSETYHNNYLGKGHFRWNFKAHILTESEIKRVKQYFNITTEPKNKTKYVKPMFQIAEGLL